MPPILFKKSFPLTQDLNYFLHPSGFFGWGKADIPIDIRVNFCFNFPLNPELKVLNFEALGQSVYFVYDHQNPVFSFVDELVDLFNLAALEVGDVYHVHDDGPRIDLLKNISDDVATVKLRNVVS